MIKQTYMSGVNEIALRIKANSIPIKNQIT